MNNRDEIKKLIKEQLESSLPYADTRADIQVQQTDPSSEIMDVIAAIRFLNGQIQYVEDGAILATTNNKQSFFAIIDALDKNDNVLDYEPFLMQTDAVGGVRDVTDEIDIDDVRDMKYFYFKVIAYMNPELVQFDPTYVDIEQTLDSSKYTEVEDNQTYVMESDVINYAKLKNINECEVYIVEKKYGTEVHLVPPTTHNADKYFDIIEYNINQTEDDAEKVQFQDLGFTIANAGRIKEIDIEFEGSVRTAYIYNVNARDRDGSAKRDKNDKYESPTVFSEMLNTIIEKTDLSIFEKLSLDEAILTELQRRYKVDSTAKKRIKYLCQRGFKYDPERRVCVKITGSAMMDMKRAHIRANRTKKAKGRGFEVKRLRKMRKANRFRKLLGVRDGRF